jgi:hypothetical protein
VRFRAPLQIFYKRSFGSGCVVTFGLGWTRGFFLDQWWVRERPCRGCNDCVQLCKEFAFEKWRDWDNELFDNAASLLKEFASFITP